MSKEGKPIEINLKHSGKCIVCDRAMGIGEKALWQPGTGIAHPWHFTQEQKEQPYLLDAFLKKF